MTVYRVVGANVDVYFLRDNSNALGGWYGRRVARGSLVIVLESTHWSDHYWFLTDVGIGVVLLHSEELVPL